MAVIGWRTWAVADGRLVSPIMGDWWEPGQPLTAEKCAGCRVALRREWPNRDRCSCGIYSFVDPAECAWQDKYPLSVGKHVLGSVSAWGRTVPHRLGQRSLHARITAFYLWPDTTEAVIKLLLEYPVPILKAYHQSWWDSRWTSVPERYWSWHANQPPEPKEQ